MDRERMYDWIRADEALSRAELEEILPSEDAIYSDIPDQLPRDVVEALEDAGFEDIYTYPGLGVLQTVNTAFKSGEDRSWTFDEFVGRDRVAR